MFSKEIFTLLKEVISSWQVIVITIGLILYLNIVFYASRVYHRPRMDLKNKISSRIKKYRSKSKSGISESITESNPKDELGLEEA